MDLLIIFLVMALLLLLKGFFSGSEIALVNSDKFKMHHKANQGHRGAKLLLKLFQTPDVLPGQNRTSRWPTCWCVAKRTRKPHSLFCHSVESRSLYDRIAVGSGVGIALII